jgi:hypothetical protein
VRRGEVMGRTERNGGIAPFHRLVWQVMTKEPYRSARRDQAEIYHSIIQRKVLAPNDFTDTAEVARTLNEFEHHYNQIAKRFDWKFTRQDLAEFLDRLDQRQRDPPSALAA